MKDPKLIVSEGYDQVAERYLEWRAQPGAHVLDIGCGAGIPVTLALSKSFDVTGVDISARQIGLAATNAPLASFIHGDVTTLDFAPASFDAAVASYSLFHVPRAEHHTLFRSIAGWLRRGGVLLANFGVGDKEVDYDEDWLGAPQFWSSFDADGERAAMTAAGFSLVFDSIETIIEDGRPHPFLLVLARKP
ncbi:MAG TPA: class I SAM-dependent methyltransferase [Blastocatellia bacterium]|jgi:SAM-dependent methyltransferase|nr:class I SAM-dependent methyltransferase [Blastocatellia bacterium]